MAREDLDTSGETRQRRLLFRSWHRGTRELDLVLGPFAEAELARFTDAELDEFERWLDLPDPLLFAWVSGAADTPADIDTPLFRRLLAFHHARAAT